MRFAVILLALSGLVTSCGVTTQDEPQPLVTSTANPVPTPTLTQRPDPTTPTSTGPTTTTGATPTTTRPSPAGGPTASR